MDARIGGDRGASRLQEALRRNGARQLGSLRRLSSGERTADAGGDPAGLAISNRMRAELRSLFESSRAARSGVDLASRADAGLAETGDNLARMRELAVQASNETLSAEDRAVLDQEYQALAAEVDAVAETTEFNGQGLLDGSLGASVPIDTDGGEVLEAPTVDVSVAALNLPASIADTQDARDALERIDEAQVEIGRARADYGAFTNRLESVQRSTAIERENLADAESRISSLDVALESARLVGERMLADATVAALVHSNASSNRALELLS